MFGSLRNRNSPNDSRGERNAVMFAAEGGERNVHKPGNTVFEEEDDGDTAFMVKTAVAGILKTIEGENIYLFTG